MHLRCALGKDECTKKVDKKIYRGMIQSLLCPIVLMFDNFSSVRLCARFQSNSRESHMSDVKMIFRYFKGNTNISYIRNQMITNY